MPADFHHTVRLPLQQKGNPRYEYLHVAYRLEFTMQCSVAVTLTNSINDITRFCSTRSSPTHLIMGASFTCRWYMFYGFVRSNHHSQMYFRMAVLSTCLFAGWFAKALWSCFLQPSLEGGLELFWEFL